MKRIFILLIAIVISATACGAQPAANETETAVTTNNIPADDSKTIALTAPSSSGGGDIKTTETKILLGDTIAVKGDGALLNGNTVTITEAGTYIISGTADDGQIVIDAAKSTVNLVLDGAYLTNKTGAPIYAAKYGQLTITLADGSENTLTDGGDDFVYADVDKEEPNAALFCKKDVTFDGNGKLTVNAGFNNGIGSKGNLVIESGEFVINAAHTGLRGNDSVTVSGGSFIIDSADDSVHSNGNISITGGSLALNSGDDAVHADGDLTVSGGDINIVKSYEGLEASNIYISGGNILVHADDDGINASSSDGNAENSAGFFGRGGFQNAGGGMPGSGDYKVVISGGVVTVFSGSDGIDSNGTLDITGGTVAIFVNAPFDGDATDTESGGTILPALYAKTNVDAGVRISVGDLWSIVTEAEATAFCLIIPGVSDGQSYGITADGAALTTVTATTTIQGMMTGGRGEFGGFGGFGGMPEPGQPGGGRR